MTEEKKIEDYTVEELKAFGFDMVNQLGALSEQYKRLSEQLKGVNQLILDKSKVEEKEPANV